VHFYPQQPFIFPFFINLENNKKLLLKLVQNWKFRLSNPPLRQAPKLTGNVVPHKPALKNSPTDKLRHDSNNLTN